MQKKKVEKDECDWCGEITEVKPYPKDRKFKYCKECTKEVDADN